MNQKKVLVMSTLETSCRGRTESLHWYFSQSFIGKEQKKKKHSEFLMPYLVRLLVGKTRQAIY